MSRTLSAATVLVTMLALAALACNFPGIGSTPEPPTGTPLPEVTDEPAGEPTEEPTEEPAPAGVLPAPLYFIRDDGQVWRVEVDGATLTQITSEPAQVDAFDISPSDGQIAYVSSNDLITADALGGGRTVLVTMPDVAPDDYEGQVNATLSKPAWAPDGQSLAYGLGGVNVYDFASGTSTLLLASSPYPTDFADMPPDPILFYFPNAYTPAASRLLVDFAYYPEAGGLAVLDLVSGDLVTLNNPDGLVCCYPSWAADGASVFFASPVYGLTSVGLWQADAVTGVGVTLVPGFDDPTWSQFSHPQQLGDGQLYYFFGTSTEDWPTDRPPLTMHRSAPDGVTGRVALRTDAYYPGGAVWAPDGSGAAITDFTTTTDYTYGPLLWLDADDSPALPLGAMARSTLRWGQ